MPPTSPERRSTRRAAPCVERAVRRITEVPCVEPYCHVYKAVRALQRAQRLPADEIARVFQRRRQRLVDEQRFAGGDLRKREAGNFAGMNGNVLAGNGRVFRLAAIEQGHRARVERRHAAAAEIIGHLGLDVALAHQGFADKNGAGAAADPGAG